MRFEVLARRLYISISKAPLQVQVLAGIGAAVVLTCVGVEVILRLVGYENVILTKFSPDLGRVGRPYLRGIQSIEGRSEVEFNSRGYHDVDHPLEKGPGVFRIVVLGDSYSAGVQVELGDTYVQRLSSELQSCSYLEGRKVELVNLAVNGYNLHQFYVTEKEVVPTFSPDLLFVAVTPNPTLLVRGAAQASLSPVVEFTGDDAVISRKFRDSATYRIKTSSIYGLFVRVSDHVRLIQFLMEAEFRYRSKQSSDGDDAGGVTQRTPGGDDEYPWLITQRLLVGMDSVSRVQHIPILFGLTAPDEIDSVRSTSNIIRQRDERYRAIFAQLHLPLVAIADEMHSYAVEHDVYLNGFGAFGSGYGHWNREGNHVAAQLYAAGICRWLRTRSDAHHGT